MILELCVELLRGQRAVTNRNCYENAMTPHGHEPEMLARGLARVPRLAGRGLVILYRYTLSPLIGPRCRHLPSCSEYADEALARFGLWAGGWMALARILRCQPWGTSGLDFVPAQVSPRARWWLPWRYGRWRGVNMMPATKNGGNPAQT